MAESITVETDARSSLCPGPLMALTVRKAH